MAKAKERVYDEPNERFNIKEGEKDGYHLARQKNQAGKDVQKVQGIKNQDGNVITSEESVLRG